MTRRMQLLGPEERPSARRLAAMAARIREGLPEGWARGDRAVPAVLTVLALLIFAWIAAGALIGGMDPGEEASSPASVAQAPGGPKGGGSGTTPAPGVEDRDADSYAAYDEPKDPFRQIIPKANEGDGNESTNGGGGNESTNGGGGDARGGGDRDQDSDPDSRGGRTDSTDGPSGGANRGNNANRDSNADRDSNANRGSNADRDSNADRGSGGRGDGGGVDGGSGGGSSSDGDEDSTGQPSPGGPEPGGGVPGQDGAGNLFGSGGDLELP